LKSDNEARGADSEIELEPREPATHPEHPRREAAAEPRPSASCWNAAAVDAEGKKSLDITGCPPFADFAKGLA
jgi:hypothetical protein